MALYDLNVFVWNTLNNLYIGLCMYNIMINVCYVIVFFNMYR